MGWNMAAVDAPASAVRIPLSDIPADVAESIEEAFAFCQENPRKRLIIPFGSQDDQELSRAQIRSYCEQRKAGRLTASIWAGYAGTEDADGQVVTRFSQTETEMCKAPALSLALTVYVKREKPAADTPPAA